MIFIVVNIIFVLAAVSMVVLILLQRGAGAAAGSGFGGGASATVFGARGSANFLSKATKWLAVVFFSISLGLAIYTSKPHEVKSAADDLGVMSQAPAASRTPTIPHPNGGAMVLPSATTPAAPAVALPAIPTPAVPTPAMPSAMPGVPNNMAPDNGVPTGGAPVNAVPAIPLPQPMAPVPNADTSAKPDAGAKPGNKGG
jgi:preprotein translocase subunit SecG